MVTCYIGLGSNLNNPSDQIQQALHRLAAINDIQLQQASSLYRSAPMGPQDQPDFINAVACIQTVLSPQDLLRQTQEIELAQGRMRGAERWTARTLDIDILLYGNKIIKSEQLVVPHPGIKTRNFVLYPLQEIAPQLWIPQMGTVSDLLAGCGLGDLVKLQ